jgi:predicted ATPase
MLAALLGPEPAGLYFIEELENGLHPARLHLLLDLIESRVKEGALQVVVTTHSPQLLRLLSPASRDNALLVHRLQGEAAAQLKAIRELPAEAREVVGRKDVGELFQAGWFENVMSFLQDEQTPAEGE